MLISSNAHAHDLICSNENETVNIARRARPSESIRLQGKGEVCANGFTFIRDAEDERRGFLLISPTELGLNAKYSVYRISFIKSIAVSIGELPVSAAEIKRGVFVNVHQEGGSVYMEKYKLTPTQVERDPIGFELVMDGDVCIDKNSLVKNANQTTKSSCAKVMQATFKTPVCLTHKNGAAFLSPRTACKDIEQNR